jgi:DNA primase
MARIPQAEIDRIQQDVAVERLVEEGGVALKKVGKDRWGLCPFHADKNPSLSVTPSNNLWRCFACQIGGGPIEWVMKKNGVSFRHAVELLREGVSSLVAQPVKHTTVRKLPAPVAVDADDQALLNQVVGYYCETLKQSPEALDYLKRRGLDHPELIDRFKLGFANRTLGLRLPDKTRVAGAEIRTRLQTLGLIRDSGHEHFNGSLVVPVFDDAGNVTEIYGRKITDKLRPGTPLHLYLPGPHRGVWNIEALQASKEIILCEALIDAMTFWRHGYRNVTASYGVEGFTDDHLAALKQHGAERVLIAYDRDDAGEAAAAKVAERLMREGIDCWRIQFPKGMDANEYALKVTPAAKSLGVAIRKALWLGNGAAPDREIAAASVIPCSTEPSFPQHAPPLAAKEAEVAAPLPATPAPASPIDDLPVEVRAHEVLIPIGDRHYRVRGLAKNLAFGVLKAQIIVTQNEAVYGDVIDLAQAKARAGFVTQAAVELRLAPDMLKRDLGRVWLKCEALQEAAIDAVLKPKAPALPQMTPAEQTAALALLRDPALMDRIVANFDACGLIGEAVNKRVAYLAAVSRKLDRPLGVVIQSSSAAGKTSLMDAALAFVPDEDRVKYSAMTGQSLFYMGETNLKHKALAIVEEEGASRASYALKLLQSEGELTIASTGKDPQTGNLITQPYRVEGPVALLLTTTARDLDEELLNRCLLLTVDESREQTRAIHRVQRDKRTLDGIINKHEKARLVKLHQNAQRLLKPLDVLNPYARLLTFPDQTTRLRRDHEKYLTLIDVIAFLHQHQRIVKTLRRGDETIEYIEATLDDIRLANAIAHDVLGRSLDELPPQTRRLIQRIDRYVVAECARLHVHRADFRFSRRALREAIAWGDTQLKIHLARLVELEYLVVHRAKANGFDYELVYDAADAEDALRFPGLADVDALAHAYDADRSGRTVDRSALGRGAVGPRSAGSRGAESAENPTAARLPGDSPEAAAKTQCASGNGESASYPHLPLAAAHA